MTYPATRMRTGTRTPSLALVALESLPCGCISSVFQARPTVVELEVVEAKGPHCPIAGHRAGDIVRLGMPAMLSETEEPSV